VAEAPVLRHPAWAVAAVLLIGFNLRPSITTVALFLGDIKRDLGVSVFGISGLAMLPVVCLGLFAPAAPALARRFGVETVLFVSLLGIVIGSVVRSFGVAPLYLGIVIICACLCFLGVLSPAVVKRDFPRHIGLMMGFYTMLVSVGPALSAATAVPFQHVLGGNWELVLVIWGLPALVGALAVLPRLFAHDADIRVATPHVLDLLGLVRDPLAWQVTAYFGLISALAYAVFNWGPSMLQARGLDATESGLILSVCYLSQTFAGLPAPIVACRQPRSCLCRSWNDGALRNIFAGRRPRRSRRVPLHRRSALRLRFTLRLRPALWLRGAALWLRRALRLRPLARLTRSCFRVIGEGLRVPRRPSFFVGSML
jgi:MFS transporter, CP family, cyanate transporter